jgi:hypothetical protein
VSVGYFGLTRGWMGFAHAAVCSAAAELTSCIQACGCANMGMAVPRLKQQLGQWRERELHLSRSVALALASTRKQRGYHML